MNNSELPKDLSSDELINLYKKMLLIRKFEKRITKDFGKINQLLFTLIQVEKLLLLEHLLQ